MKAQIHHRPIPIRRNKKSLTMAVHLIDEIFPIVKSQKAIPDSKKTKTTSPYIMIQPKVIEQFDSKNNKSLKVSFQNSIKKIETFDEPKKNKGFLSTRNQYELSRKRSQGLSQLNKLELGQLTHREGIRGLRMVTQS